MDLSCKYYDYDNDKKSMKNKTKRFNMSHVCFLAFLCLIIFFSLWFYFLNPMKRFPRPFVAYH